MLFQQWYWCFYLSKALSTFSTSAQTTWYEFVQHFVIFTGALRLVDGQHHCEGRVEMFLNSEWGTVCDDAWDLNDAKVVCHQLGCGQAMAAREEAYFGPGTGTILLDNLKCNGTEASLQECNHITWNMHNCDHSEDAGVTCSLSWFQQKHAPTSTMSRRCG